MDQIDDSLSPIEAATRRLGKALDGLESTLQKRLVEEAEADRLRGEIQTLANDRSELAQDLDAARAEVAKLTAANKDVDKRIDAVMGSIRGVLDSAGVK